MIASAVLICLTLGGLLLNVALLYKMEWVAVLAGCLFATAIYVGK